MAWFLVPWFLVPFNQIETSHNRKDSVYSKTQNSKKLKNKNSLQMHTLFTSNTLMSNARLTLKKKNAKQKPEADLLRIEKYSHFSSTLSLKNDKTYSKK